MFKTEVEKMNGIVFGDEGKPFSAWGLQFVTLFPFFAFMSLYFTR